MERSIRSISDIHELEVVSTKINKLKTSLDDFYNVVDIMKECHGLLSDDICDDLESLAKKLKPTLRVLKHKKQEINDQYLYLHTKWALSGLETEGE